VLGDLVGIRLLLAAAHASRPKLSRIAEVLLSAMSKDGQVRFRYVIAGRELEGTVRLDHLDSDMQSVMELAIDDRYRLAQIPEPSIVIDGGGNTGLFTLAAASYWPRAHVVICEPVPHNVQSIRQLLELNAIHNARLLPVALAGSQGEKRFFCREANQGSFDPDIEWSDAIRVETVTLTKIVEDARASSPNGIVLVKLDIEGAEFDVLREFVQFGSPRNTIIVLEVHGPLEARESFNDIARSGGFEIEYFEEAHVTAHCQLTSRDLVRRDSESIKR